MRILHVIAGAGTGGAETFALDAISALAQEGLEQHVICRPHAIALSRYAEAGVPITEMSFSPISRFLGAPRRIRQLAETLRVDLVHAWMGRAASFVPGPSLFGRAMPCPVIGWFGGYYSLKYYKSSDFYVGVTPDIRKHFIESGAPPHRAFVCHTFGTLPESPPVNRETFDTPQDALVLLVLSRMHTKKGIDTAIEAMFHLQNAYLWLAGDGPEMAKYQTLVQTLGLGSRVRFLGWRTDRKSLLEACDICLLPSRYEPFGTVIAEAWSARKPLVTTLADGARQFVEDNVDGVIVPFNDPKALAQRVRDIAADQAFADRLCENGYAKYQRLFSRPVVVHRLLEIYDTALKFGARRDEAMVAARALSPQAVAAIANELRPVVRPERQLGVMAAVETALAYYNHQEGQDVSIAVDAGLMALTGLRSYIETDGSTKFVRILKDLAFHANLDGIDVEALRTQNAAFVQTLTGLFERPSW